MRADRQARNDFARIGVERVEGTLQDMVAPLPDVGCGEVDIGAAVRVIQPAIEIARRRREIVNHAGDDRDDERMTAELPVEEMPHAGAVAAHADVAHQKLGILGREAGQRPMPYAVARPGADAAQRGRHQPRRDDKFARRRMAEFLE